MQSGENLMGFVDDGEIERRAGAELDRAALASGEFPADQIYGWRREASLVFNCLDAEQIQELALPLADQRLRHDQQDASRTFRTTLGNNQAGLNRLSQANLVCENAAAFAKTSQRKDNCVNLVGIGINPRLALCSRIALPIVRTADANKVLRENPLVEDMHSECVRFNSRALRSVRAHLFDEQVHIEVKAMKFHFPNSLARSCGRFRFAFSGHQLRIVRKIEFNRDTLPEISVQRQRLSNEVRSGVACS
jgi:hypothetical protein